jgi:hypothetical protein
MSEQSTCGHGLAEQSVLHASLSRLVAAIGRNLELHLAALDPSDDPSKPEYDAYTELVAQHRDLETRLRTTADTMASCRDLPMASHDPEVMGGAPVMQAFEALLVEEEQLVELLQGWLVADRALLADSERGEECDG